MQVFRLRVQVCILFLLREKYDDLQNISTTRLQTDNNKFKF